MKKNIPIRIKVLSVGGRGANILERLGFLEKKGVDRVGVGIESKVFNRLDIKKKIVLRKEEGLESSGNKEMRLGDILEEKKQDIIATLRDTDALFLIGNLANTTTHLQVAMIAQIAKELGILTFFVGATPFLFEGKKKILHAKENAEYLEKYVDAVLLLDSDKVNIQNILAFEAMTKIDTLVGNIISAVVELVQKFGIVNVDFADLKTTIQDAGEVFFNEVTLSKENLDTLNTELFEKNTLFQKKKKLQKILYVIYGGTDLLMEEVQMIGEKLQEQFDKQSRIIFGVVNDEKMKNDLRVVMIGA
ncbi:MAG: hypothetical protein V1848_01175 [Candidatus Magasanikbacteria bacterium]